MGFVKAQRYCVTENRRVLAEKQTPNQILHLLLTIVTGGLWLPVWIAVNLFAKPYLCTSCGSKTEGLWMAKREEKKALRAARKTGNQ